MSRGHKIDNRISNRFDRRRELLRSDAKRWHQDNHIADRPREQTTIPRRQTNVSRQLRRVWRDQSDPRDETALPDFLYGGQTLQSFEFVMHLLDLWVQVFQNIFVLKNFET